MTMVAGLPEAGKSRRATGGQLLRLLDGLESDAEIEAVSLVLAEDEPADSEWVPRVALDSPTGFVTIVGPDVSLALVPFLPIVDAVPMSADFSAIREFALQRRTVAIVLLRLGAYAVGVAMDGQLQVTKSDTRYVMGRHRKGGQSQRRFERNREKWVRELYDKACSDAKQRFAPFGNAIDCLAVGGDRQVLNSFMKRCTALDPLSQKMLPRRISVDRPNTGALHAAVDELWSWQVYRA